MVSQAYLNLKRYADAEKDATVVLQADPGNIKASYRRGRARLNLPQPDKEGGCTDLARVVSQNPKNQNEVSRWQVVYLSSRMAMVTGLLP